MQADPHSPVTGVGRHFASAFTEITESRLAGWNLPIYRRGPSRTRLVQSQVTKTPLRSHHVLAIISSGLGRNTWLHFRISNSVMHKVNFQSLPLITAYNWNIITVIFQRWKCFEIASCRSEDARTPEIFQSRWKHQLGSVGWDAPAAALSDLDIQVESLFPH